MHNLTQSTLNMSDSDFTNIDLERQEKKDEIIDNNSQCCLSCSTTIIVFGMLSSYIIWMVFAIKSLINNSNQDIKDKCENSDIWVCLLVVVIISGLQLITNNNSLVSNKTESESETSMYSIFVKVVLDITVAIWAGIELFNPCVQDKLDVNNVYIMLEIWFYASCVMLGLVLVIFCCSCTYFAHEINKLDI